MKLYTKAVGLHFGMFCLHAGNFMLLPTPPCVKFLYICVAAKV